MVNIINCTSKKDAVFFVDFLKTQGTESVIQPISGTECYGIAIEDNELNNAQTQLSYITNYDIIKHNFEGSVNWSGGQPFYITVGVSSKIPEEEECVIANIPTIIRKDEIPFESSEMIADYRIPLNFINPTSWQYSRYLCEIMGEPHNCKVPAIEHGIMAFTKNQQDEGTCINNTVNVFCGVDDAVMAAIRTKGLKPKAEEGFIDITLDNFELAKFNSAVINDEEIGEKFLVAMLCEALKNKVYPLYPDLKEQFGDDNSKELIIAIVSQLEETVRVNICVREESGDTNDPKWLLANLPKSLKVLFNVYFNQGHNNSLSLQDTDFWPREVWTRENKELIYLSGTEENWQDVNNYIIGLLQKHNIPYTIVTDQATICPGVVCFSDDLKAAGIYEDLKMFYGTKKRHGLGKINIIEV